MPRLMSVSLTEQQVRDRTKTVIRRMGWNYLRPGQRLTLCRKVMVRRRSEPLVRLVDVEVLSVSRERLDTITASELAAEGFPRWTATEFVEFFCATHKGCQPDSTVTRIQWRYLAPPSEQCALEWDTTGTHTADAGAAAARKDERRAG